MSALATTPRTAERAIRLDHCTIPGSFVHDLLVQTGLSRDQIRWGLNLACADGLTTPARLRSDVEHERLLTLSDLLVYVGAGDIESAGEYREYRADVDADQPCPNCQGRYGRYNVYHPQGHCLSCQPALAGDR